MMRLDTRTHLKNVTLLLLVTLVSAGIAFAANRSPALDPVMVAPHIYETLIENDRVRVLQAIYRNGETPPLHSHPDRVRVYLNPCAWMVEGDDGSVNMESFKFGEPVWEPAMTHGGETSSVIEQCTILEIELL
jgi:hypothetical protein